MKSQSIIKRILLILTVIIISSCSEKADTAYLHFLEYDETHTVNDLGNSLEIDIATNINDWVAESPTVDWVTLTKLSNSKLLVEFQHNPNSASRNVNITIYKAGDNGAYDTLEITQEAKSEDRVEIYIGNKKVNFLNIEDQKSLDFTIQSNCNWTLTSSNWITTNTTIGKLGKTEMSINLSPNSEKERQGSLNFKLNASIDAVIVVGQLGDKTDFQSVTHCFYTTFGTMPTLYSGLDVLSHDKPSYFTYQRTNTFNKVKFPKHVTVRPIESDEMKQGIFEEIMAKIVEISENEPNAIFGFFVDDLRSRMTYDWFIAQGINPARIKTTLVSDGTATYNEFYNKFGSAKTGETKWKQYAQFVDDLLATPFERTGTYNPNCDSFGYSYYTVTLPNYRYMMQDESLLETNSLFVKAKLKDMNTLSVTPYELLEKLTTERQAEFFEMANFEKSKFEAMFDESPKPNLVIIGTSKSANKDQKSYVSKIHKEKREKYNIFFKPHPNDDTAKEYENLFSGLKLLPGQMPFEIFVWSLIDKIDLIGGYSSTVYLTVPIEKVDFIFDEMQASDLPKPLDILFKDAEINWIY